MLLQHLQAREHVVRFGQTLQFVSRIRNRGRCERFPMLMERCACHLIDRPKRATVKYHQRTTRPTSETGGPS
jgi:hypothetical protein